MNEPLLLDTHVWIRAQLFPELLRPSTKQRIQQAAALDLLFISVYSVWELAMLERDQRLKLTGGVDQWTRDALSLPGVFLLPLTREIAIDSVQLPFPMHKDPADRIIVASARVEQMTLVTADKAVLAFCKTTGLAHIRA